MKQRRRGLWFQMELLLLVLLILGLQAGPAISQQIPTEAPGAEQEWKEPLPSAPQVFPSEWGELKERFTVIGYLDGNLSLSHQESEGYDEGGGFNALISPVYKVNDRTALILTYDGSYRKELDFYSDNVGPRERTEYMRHTVTPMVQLELGENSRYILVPSFFYTRTYNKDVEGGGWDDGLYNYRDIGGGVDFRMKGLDFAQGSGTLKLGLQYYDRKYPNFDSLLDLATGIGTEEDEKDYRGILGKIGYTWVKTVGFSWGADYYLLYKDLEDKKIVDSNGILTSREQDDYLHNFDIALWFIPPSRPGLRLGLDLNGSWYDSDQNFYDGLGTPELNDDVFINDYYDYYAFRVGPNISYNFQVFPLTATLAYTYGRLEYTDRLAQNEDGTYKNREQWETEHALGALLSYSLNRYLNIYAQYRYVDADSNNNDSSVFQYDHTVHYFYGGMALRF